jgi:hypothetical protein
MEYIFQEGDTFVPNTVKVSKGDVISEQTLRILVQHAPDNFAQQGKYVQGVIGGTINTLWNPQHLLFVH